MPQERPHVTAERPLDAAQLTFDLTTWLGQLRAEDARWGDGHNAVTLLKNDALRIVLVALHPGAEIPVHRTEGALSIQVIDGSLQVDAGVQTLTLTAGQLLTLQAGVPHAVRAPRAAAFLLTLATLRPHAAEH